MSLMRIVAGRLGGRTIDAPRLQSRTTQPMSEQIRNAVFNRIGDEIVGATVLDAFAGTGAVGFEAISRGARHVTFIERDKVAQNIITKNMVSLGTVNDAKLVKAPVSSWVRTRKPGYYDIIFADPPYHDPQLSTVSQLFGLLKPNGLMVLSWPGRGEGPNLAKTGIVVVDNRSYGSAHLTSFRRESAE